MWGIKGKLQKQKYANLVSLENKPHVSFCSCSYPPLFEHHSLPSCPAYLCMPAKKYFVSISVPIAYDSRSAAVSSGAEKCSFEKSPRRAWRLPTSIFDAVAHFVCLPQESEPSPHRRPGHASQPIIRALSCTCPLPPCVLVCSSTPGQGAIKADAPLQLNSESLTELWWHLMRKVQVF